MSGDTDNEEDVGYKKPPKKSQFKKGESGNPKGRPNQKVFHELVSDVLNEVVHVTIKGESVPMTIKEAILKKIAIDAMNGKSTAVKSFIELMKNLSSMAPL